MSLSKHAQVRCQQRAIQPLIVDWLIRYGHRVPANDGAMICHFDKKSRKALSALSEWISTISRAEIDNLFSNVPESERWYER